MNLVFILDQLKLAKFGDFLKNVCRRQTALTVILVENQTGIGSAETEAV